MDSTFLFLQTQSTLRLSAGLLFLSLISVPLYRLYLSPLARAKIPGPKLAALTSWYEFYYDVVKGGQFTFHIQDLHRKYGPIVRINPTEVHVDDPEYYETIYSHSLHLDKLSTFNHRWDSPGSIQVTGPHSLHRLRRTALNPFFSKRQIVLLWPYILEKSEKLCSILESSYCQDKKPLNLRKAFGCFGLDIVTEYCFGKCFNDLEKPDFLSNLIPVMQYLLQKVHIITHFPLMRHGMNALPKWLQEKIEPGLVTVHNYQDMVENHVRTAITDHSFKKAFGGHKTIFSSILESDLPDSEKSVSRLKDEAVVLIGAGSDTIKQTLTIASFHVLSDVEVERKLVEELVKAMPDRDGTLTWAELEGLPYLTAIIQESLRLSYGVMQRSPRLSPTQAIRYGEYTVPPNYAISMDPVHMHHNEEVFSESHKFKPERWLGDPAAMKKLQRYNITFSRGTRQCLGMNLAWAELYLLLSTLFRRYEMELWETDKNCVEVEAEFFLPKMRNGEGVKVMIKKRRSEGWIYAS